DGTLELLKEFGEKHTSWCEVVSLPKNSGKGAAIRKGFEAVCDRVDFMVFTDCDLHYGLNIISERVLPDLEHNDIAIVDRSWVTESKHQAISRRIASGVFKRIVSILTGVNFKDTQAGLKGFRVEACRPIFACLTLNGFSFDVE